VAEFEDKISKLTVEEVNAALKKHIDPQRLFIVQAGDFKAEERK
jgi:zinc protease